MKIVVFKWSLVQDQLFPSGNIAITNTIYDANYINKHYEMIAKVLPKFEYVCVTDDPKNLRKEIITIPLWDKCKYLGGCYNRLFIFSKEVQDILGERFFTIDVDTTIIKDFSHLFKRASDIVLFRSRNPEVKKTKKAWRYHPGTALIKAGSFSELWDTFIKNPEQNIINSRKLFTGTDQSWVNYYLFKTDSKVDYWDTASSGIYPVTELFKTNNLPEDCCIVSWAGPRDPYEPKWKKQFKWLEQYLG